MRRFAKKKKIQCWPHCDARGKVRSSPVSHLHPVGTMNVCTHTDISIPVAAPLIRLKTTNCWLFFEMLSVFVSFSQTTCVGASSIDLMVKTTILPVSASSSRPNESSNMVVYKRKPLAAQDTFLKGVTIEILAFSIDGRVTTTFSLERSMW